MQGVTDPSPATLMHLDGRRLRIEITRAGPWSPSDRRRFLSFKNATDDQEGGVGDDQDNLPGPLIWPPLWVAPTYLASLIAVWWDALSGFEFFLAVLV